jgi:hypothetical protein
MLTGKAHQSTSAHRNDRAPDDRAGKMPQPHAANPLWSALSTHVGMRAAAPTIQRSCAACEGGSAPCPACAEQEIAVQAKLQVGPPADRYEQEADRVADQVLRMPEPGAGAPPVPTKLVSGPSAVRRQLDEAEDEKVPPTLQTKRVGSDRPVMSSAVDDYVRGLSGRGQPLSDETRRYFEPRFVSSFDRVRIHTDAAGAQSAGALRARAYTVGHHVVFSAGQYDPHSDHGRRLLAHELTHTIQQRGSGLAVQRYADCGPPEACPARLAGEIGRAQTRPMLVGDVSGAGISGMMVGNFAVNSDRLKSDLRRNATWRDFTDRMATAPNVHWEILGFSDCHGDESLNEPLRLNRAADLFRDLPAAARHQVDAVSAAPSGDCMAENVDEHGRSLNRSAFVRLVSTAVDFPEEEEAVPTTNCASPVVAATLADYIGLVMCAERAMSGTSARTMLSVMRQLYYSGQSWSRCRGAGCAFWSNVIPCGISVANPEPALGTPLFEALRDSQVVGGVDIGHLFTGLESMFCPATSVELEVPGPNWTVDIANFEFATWAGDLGSAVAQRIHDEQDNNMPTQPWNRYFLTPGSLASEEDLQGDIDAYVRRGGLSGASCRSSTTQTLTSLPGPLSQVLADYYLGFASLGEASEANSVACFVRALGGSVAGHSIVGDRIALTERIRIRTGEFGEKFYRLKWHSGYFGGGNTGSWFVAHSGSLAREFVNWLESRL